MQIYIDTRREKGFSDEGPMLETLDYTICISSTPTFLYFDLSGLWDYISIARQSSANTRIAINSVQISVGLNDRFSANNLSDNSLIVKFKRYMSSIMINHPNSHQGTVFSELLGTTR